MKNKKIKQFAFWAYDLYPYTVGAPIKEIKDNGWVEPEGYGGHSFKPIIILPLEEGVKIKEQLDKLKQERDQTYNIVHCGFLARLKQIFPRALKVIEKS